MRKEIITVLVSLLTTSLCFAQKIEYTVSPVSGAVGSMVIDGDVTGMNWIVKPDGTQYPWVTPSDGWGLGYFTANGKEYRWSKPTAIRVNLMK